MGKIIDGKKIADKINAVTAAQVKSFQRAGKTVRLGIVLVGKNPAAEVYVRQKEKKARALGIDARVYKIAGDITTAALKQKLRRIQQSDRLSGLIVQLPLPEQIDSVAVVNGIRPEIDVDCLTDANWGRLIIGTNFFEPPTPGAILEILRAFKIKLTGKRVVIIGSGILVGKPLALMLINEKATVTVCNRSTKDLRAVCRTADILVASAGRKNLVRADMIKPGAVVIDAGFSFSGGRACGDVNLKSVLKKAALVTPTPGGVGPITVAKLLRNTCHAVVSL